MCFGMYDTYLDVLHICFAYITFLIFLEDINIFVEERLMTNTQTYDFNTLIRNSPETIKGKSYASIILCYF